MQKPSKVKKKKKVSGQPHGRPCMPQVDRYTDHRPDMKK